MDEVIRRVLFAGSSLNPGTIAHELMVEAVMSSGLCDRFIWYPSGVRDDKPHLSENAIHRLQLAMLTIPPEWLYSPPQGWCQLIIDPTNVTSKETLTAKRFELLEEKYLEVGFVTGSDVLTEEGDGIMPILKWDNPGYLKTKPIWVIPRSGFAQPSDVQLPAGWNIRWFPISQPLPDIRSSNVQQMIQLGDSNWERDVNNRVRAYVKLHGLHGWIKENFQ